MIYTETEIHDIKQSLAAMTFILGDLPKLQSENQRLQEMVDTMAEELEQLKRQPQPTIERDIRALLYATEKHYESVEVIEDRASEKELTGLKAHKRLRELFPKEGEHEQNQD